VLLLHRLEDLDLRKVSAARRDESDEAHGFDDEKAGEVRFMTAREFGCDLQARLIAAAIVEVHQDVLQSHAILRRR
jgi:hypothetical protein